MNPFFLCLILSLAPITCQATMQSPAPKPNYVTGRVFLDADLNRVYSPGDIPLSGIWLTDGKNWTQSDSKGFYKISPGENCRHIYYRIPEDKMPVGDFYIAYEPSQKDKNYDFPLQPRRSSQLPRFVQTADNEESIYREWMDDMKQMAINDSLSFIIATGDICYEKGLRMHAAEFKSDNVGTLSLYTLGNHDLVAYKNRGEALYEELFGPVWYSFELPGIHFVVLPMMAGDVAPSFTPRQAFDFLATDLERTDPSRRIVIFSHDLMLENVNGRSAMVYRNDTLYLNNNLTAYIYGHRHSQISQKFPPVASDCDSVNVYATACIHKGAIDHSPALCRVFDVKPNGHLSTRTHYGVVRNQIQGHIYFADGALRLQANLWNSPSTVLQARAVSDNQVIALNQVSDWSWTATLPGTMIGNHNPIWSLKANTSDGGVMSLNLLPEPALDWICPLGGQTAQADPIWAEDKIVLSCFDDSLGSGNRIQAVDPQTGKIVWSYRTRNSVKGQIAYASGIIAAADNQGRVYAIDAQSGKLLWEKALMKAFSTAYQAGVIIGKDASGRETIYLANGSLAAALDLKTGETLWNTGIKLNSITNMSTLLLVPDNNRGTILLGGSQWLGRMAFSTLDGEKLWQIRDYDLSYNDSRPAFHNGRLYYGSHTHLVEVEAATGTILQFAPAAPALLGSTSAPQIKDTLIVTGSYDRGVVAFDRRNLKQIWNFRSHRTLLYTGAYSKDDQQTVEAGVRIEDDKVFFGAGDGRFYILNLADGRYLASFYAGAPILSSCLLREGKIYFVDFAGNLFCLDVGKMLHL